MRQVYVLLLVVYKKAGSFYLVALVFIKCYYRLTVTTGFLQGHELTLRVLYRLFGEAEEDRDFFSSTTATSVYEMFLLAVVCAYIFSFFVLCKNQDMLSLFLFQCR